MVFGVDHLKYASQIWLRQTLVAMVTKICDFKHKIGYLTYLVHEVRPRCLHAVGGCQDRPIEWCQSNFAQTTPVARVTKIYRILTANLL